MFMYVGFLFNIPFIFGLFLFPFGPYILFTKIKKISPNNYKKHIIFTLLLVLLVSLIHIYFMDDVIKIFHTYGS
jgi:hypothetical protein